MPLKETITGIVILCTNLLEGITGFGSAVLALPFLNITIGLHTAVKLLCFFGWAIPVYIICRSFRCINLPAFWRVIMWCGPGVPVGLLLFGVLPAEILCIILGAFMVAIGINGTRPPKANAITPEEAGKSPLLRACLFFGGIIQGAFGTGGPFVVIYAAKALPDKSLFRVTLSLLWLTVNSIRLAVWGIRGELSDPALWKLGLICLPFWAAGVLLGDWLHNKVSEETFRRIVYILLAVSGAVMLLNNLQKLLA